MLWTILLILECPVPCLYIDNVQQMSCPQRWKIQIIHKNRNSTCKIFRFLFPCQRSSPYLNVDEWLIKKIAVIVEKIWYSDWKRCGQDKLHRQCTGNVLSATFLSATLKIQIILKNRRIKVLFQFAFQMCPPYLNAEEYRNNN